MVNTFDVFVLAGSGLVGGICIGLLVREKQIKRLKDLVDASHRSYDTLLDVYMEKFYSQSLEKARVTVAKKKPGRPKGSTNKAKDNGRPTTRKYTRKASK